VGIGGLSRFEERFGALALPLLCLGLAVCCVAAVAVSQNLALGAAWPLLAVDVLTLTVLLPTVVVASGIEVADVRLGGRPASFLAAATAVVCVMVVVAILAFWLTVAAPSLAQLAVLPAALLVAVALAGAERFSAGHLAAGLSLAWMVASVVTILDGLSRHAVRSLLPAISFAAFVILVSLLARSGATAEVDARNTMIALVVTACAGALLLLMTAAPRVAPVASSSDEDGASD
jgi:hypothetical protein